LCVCLYLFFLLSSVFIIITLDDYFIIVLGFLNRVKAQALLQATLDRNLIS